MLTFQQMYQDAQEQVQDYSAETLVLIKRGLNQGMQKFGSILNREYRIIDRTFDIQDGEQWYQMPENCIRPKNIVVSIGGRNYPLTEVVDSDKWEDMNRHNTTTSNFPEYFRVQGADLFGIWPTPATDVADGGKIYYEPRMRRMSSDDYITGSVTLSSENQNVVGTGTAWTAKMVGRTMIVEDQGEMDGISHKIVGFTDSTHIALENFWNSDGITTANYRIGDVPDLPDEYHESLIDWACYRVYKRRKDRSMAADAMNAFKDSIEECRVSYSSATSSQYIPPTRRRGAGYMHGHHDLRITG